MIRRLFDLGVALAGLAVTFPLLLFAAVGIALTSPGPVLYRALRAGRYGKPFVMYKFRTMHHARPAGGSAITGADDPRVFPFGSLLRRLKIDELPQLFNVLRGEMSIVGPRPEDPEIVRDHYTEEQLETLQVRPGLASPGSIYNYTHGDRFLAGDDPRQAYVEELLPVKLALDLVYVRRATLAYDVSVIARTAAVIAGIALGRRVFPDPPEMRRASESLGRADRAAAS